MIVPWPAPDFAELTETVRLAVAARQACSQSMILAARVSQSAHSIFFLWLLRAVHAIVRGQAQIPAIEQAVVEAEDVRRAVADLWKLSPPDGSVDERGLPFIVWRMHLLPRFLAPEYQLSKAAAHGLLRGLRESPADVQGQTWSDDRSRDLEEWRTSYRLHDAGIRQADLQKMIDAGRSHPCWEKLVGAV